MAIPAERLDEVGRTELQPVSDAFDQSKFDVVTLDGLPPELARSGFLEDIDIIGIREGGLVECYVPFGLVDNEEVPVKEEWASSLARQMGDIAEAEGGTGQHVPVTLGLIEGEPTLKIMDGFHRSAALRLRGEDKVYATVKVTDWNDLYDFRIFTAKDHAHVRFSRVVQWMREVWNYSDLADKMTLEQAVLLYRYEGSGAKLGLEPEVVDQAKNWVAHKESGWDIKAMTIHSYLKVAEAVDPKLVHSTREKRRSDILDAPTQIILKIFADEIPNDFRMQNLVMNTARIVRLPNAKGGTRSMNGPEIRALCQKAKDCETVEEAASTIAKIDWKNWELEYSETKRRALRRAHDPRHKGAAALEKTVKEIAGVRERVQLSKERGEDISETQKQLIKETRVKAQEVIGDLGALIIELSQLIGEKPPTVQMPRPAERRPSLLKPEDIERRKAQREIEEHEGLTDILVRRDGERSPKTIQDMVDACLRGLIEPDDVLIPDTPSERRQYRVALSLAADMPADVRVGNWKERFRELQVLGNPALAEVLDT